MASSPYQSDRLYALLPAVYRERDAQVGEPLRALLSIVAEQADIVHADIGQLWDDFFVETCRAWVVPYIGDLVGNETLYDASRLYDGQRTADSLFPDLTGPSLRPLFELRTRADVAKTIYYRRRKGTVPMLEELARDVTGWPAHAVEMFRLLGWTQHLEFQAPERLDCVRLNEVEPLDRLDGGFDRWAHTVDVRAPAQEEGWHGIPKLALFLWRLKAQRMVRTQARQGPATWQYSFSVLGHKAPLFHPRRREAGERELATELHVPGPIRPALFYTDLVEHPGAATTELYGPSSDHALLIEHNGVAVPAGAASGPHVVCRCLDPWPATRPSGEVFVVDPSSGRLVLGTGIGPTNSLELIHNFGSCADLGGGPYERGAWLVDESLAGVTRLRIPDDHATLTAALAAWQSLGKPNTVISIRDNRSYAEPLQLELADDSWLVIEAANGYRPHLQPSGGEIELTGMHPEASLTLSGLLIEGSVHVSGSLGRLRLLHTTLVPGRGLDPEGVPVCADPSVVVDAVDATSVLLNSDFELEAAFSLLGPISIPEHASSATLLDCIVDGLGGAALRGAGTSSFGPPLHIERTTVFGGGKLKRLEASECIFTAPVEARQLHDGCVRFSYVAPGSRVPRRYRCQPELATQLALERAEASTGPLSPSQTAALRQAVETRVVPSFVEQHYGQPAYAQLRLRCAAEILTGSESGAEMGALCHLQQPQREANLRVRLREYLPFGLIPGIIYVT